MEYKKVLEHIKPYKPGLSEDDIKKKYNLENVVKLASNENPYGASKNLKRIFDSQKAAIYPDNYCTELRKKLSQKLGISESKLVFGNGSVEIIQMLARVFIEKDDEVVTCTPTFQSYYLETYIENGKVISVPVLDDYKFNLEGILEKITDKTKMVYITNPNNPTGTIVEKNEMIQFLEKVPNRVCVILDEAYAEFVNNKNYPNSIKLFEKYNNICILKTFSKAYGLASFRIGYGIASEELVTELEKVRLPFNVSGIAQEAAIIAIEDEEFLNNCKKNNREVIEYVYRKLTEYKITYIETETNFIMIDTKKDSNFIAEKLQQNGFIVRPNFPNMQTFIRVTVGTRDEMTQFVECLNEILKEN